RVLVQKTVQVEFRTANTDDAHEAEVAGGLPELALRALRAGQRPAHRAAPDAVVRLVERALSRLRLRRARARPDLRIKGRLVVGDRREAPLRLLAVLGQILLIFVLALTAKRIQH